MSQTALRDESAALAQVRETTRALLAEGKVDEAFEFMLQALKAVLRKSRELELLIAKLSKQSAGKRSERINPAQLELLFEQLCAQEPGRIETLESEAEARADAELDQEIAQAERQRDEQRGQEQPARRARGVVTRNVERQVHHHRLPEEQRGCEECGGVKQFIGEDVTRELEFIPGHFVEHEHHQEKYACPKCREGVTTAQGPNKVIPRSPAGASLLAHTVVSKHVDHCPLHRLHRIYDRSGATIAVSTLADWTAAVADLVDPLVVELEQRVLKAEIIRTDATGIKVLDPTSPENVERGTMWCYVGDDRDVVFRYTPTGEGATGPWEFLLGREGYIQADAASVFDRLYNGRVGQAIEVGCLVHARRKLVELQDTDCRVAYPLKLVARLYRVEHLADAQEASHEQRQKLRQERSAPIMDRLKRWAVATCRSEPPGSALAQATAYMLNHWVALARFLEDGRLDLDNNLTERQLRSIALGRRNYLFSGSHDAAQRAARLYSLMRTCAQYGVEPLAYLTDILRKLADAWPQSRIAELLPGNWQPAPVTIQT